MESVFDRLSHVVNLIVDPACALQDFEQRRQARLLASMLVAFIILVVWMIVVRAREVLAIPGTSPSQLIVVSVVGLALCVLYWGSRTVHYKISAIMTVCLVFFAIHSAPFIAGGDAYNFLFGLVPILLAGIFWGGGWSLVLTAGNIGSMLLYFGVTNTAMGPYSWYFRLMLAAVGVLLIFMRYRSAVERDRRTALEHALGESQHLNTAIRASEAQLRVVVDASPDMIFYVNAEGIIQYFNRDDEAHSLIGQQIAGAIAPEAGNLIMQAMQRSATEQSAATYEISTAEGVHYSIRIGAIQEDAAVSGFVVAVTDITVQKQAEVQAEHEQRQEELIQSQRQLLQELSTPVIPVLEGVVILPLIGSIDTQRAQDIIRRLLEGITEHRAQIVLIDMTGVPLLDTDVVNYLNKAIQAARLKGTRTIVTGVSDAIAEAIVELGIDWSDVQTLANVQTGLRAALRALN